MNLKAVFAKDILLNHKGTGLVKYREDWHRLKTMNLKPCRGTLRDMVFLGTLKAPTSQFAHIEMLASIFQIRRL